MKGPRCNEEIRVAQVRVIEENKMVGVMPTQEAIRLARSKDVDLIEIDAKASPPVCKLMELGKFKYEQKKKDQASKQPKVETKEIRLRPNTDTHDLETKMRHIRRFLEEGHRVRIVMAFHGREMAYKNQGETKLKSMVETLGAKIDGKIQSEGNKISLVVMTAE